MPDFGGFADKAKEFAGQHSDQVDQEVQKAGDAVDQKTGGRFGDQIKQGEQRAEDQLGTGGQNDQDGQNQNQ
jgi:hypothetical protein